MISMNDDVKRGAGLIKSRKISPKVLEKKSKARDMLS